jgi:hypothetical protein
MSKLLFEFFDGLNNSFFPVRLVMTQRKAQLNQLLDVFSVKSSDLSVNISSDIENLKP